MMEVYQTVYAPILEININSQPILLSIDQSGRGVPGQDGRSVEMRQFGNKIQWRNIGNENALWNDLFDMGTLVVSPSTEIKTISASVAATDQDTGFLILLDGSTQAVTYTINPALWAKKKVSIRCIDATFAVKIAVSSGVIEAVNFDNVTELGLQKRETLSTYCDGAKIIIL